MGQNIIKYSAAATLLGVSANAQENLELIGVPTPSGTGFQPAVTELARDLQWLDGMLLIIITCLLYTSPSPRDLSTSRMPSSA